jgi:hypothetical protein
VLVVPPMEGKRWWRWAAAMSLVFVAQRLSASTGIAFAVHAAASLWIFARATGEAQTTRGRS